MESLVHQQGAVQAILVKSETAIVSQLLQQTNEAAGAAEDEARQRAEEEDRADIDELLRRSNSSIPVMPAAAL